MNNYSIRIEIPEGEIKNIFDKMNEAQETIRKCYSELQMLGVVKITEKPSAATDGDSN